MRRLLANEWVKIRYSRSFKAVFIVLVLFVFIFAAIQAGDGGRLGDYGFHIPFISIGAFGAMGSFIYAALAATIIGGEFEYGIVHNIFSCGIGKKGYYIAKQIGVYSASALIYFLVMFLHTLVITLRYGFGPEEIISDKYWLEALVYTVAVLIWLAANLSIYCFIAFLLRKAVLTFIVCVSWGIIDSFISMIAYKTGKTFMISFTGIMNKMVASFQSGEILSMGFCKLLFPCIIIVVISVISGYWLFANRDIQ